MRHRRNAASTKKDIKGELDIDVDYKTLLKMLANLRARLAAVKLIDKIKVSHSISATKPNLTFTI